MYHRVLIPEQDQQVHWYLWRNMETNWGPDVYEKTVLTFGDKPAHAMAQITEKNRTPSKEFVSRSCSGIEEQYLHGRHLWFSPFRSASQATDNWSGWSISEKWISSQGLGWLSNQSLENEIVGQEKPEMKLLQGTTKEKILGTVWNHAKDMLLSNVNLREQFSARLLEYLIQLDSQQPS